MYDKADFKEIYKAFNTKLIFHTFTDDLSGCSAVSLCSPNPVMSVQLFSAYARSEGDAEAKYTAGGDNKISPPHNVPAPHCTVQCGVVVTMTVCPSPASTLQYILLC